MLFLVQFKTTQSLVGIKVLLGEIEQENDLSILANNYRERQG